MCGAALDKRFQFLKRYSYSKHREKDLHFQKPYSGRTFYSGWVSSSRQSERWAAEACLATPLGADPIQPRPGARTTGGPSPVSPPRPGACAVQGSCASSAWRAERGCLLSPITSWFVHKGMWAMLAAMESGLFLCQCPPGAVRHCHTLFVVLQRNVPVRSCGLLWACVPGGVLVLAACRPHPPQTQNGPISSSVPGGRGLCRHGAFPPPFFAPFWVHAVRGCGDPAGCRSWTTGSPSVPETC